MPTPLKSLRCASALTLIALLLGGCATRSPAQPPEIARSVSLTPLPASVKQIDLKQSEAWQGKVSNYFQKVEAFSSSETSK